MNGSALTFPHNNHQKSFWDPLQQEIKYEQSNNKDRETNNTVYWIADVGVTGDGDTAGSHWTHFKDSD